RRPVEMTIPILALRSVFAFGPGRFRLARGFFRHALRRLCLGGSFFRRRLLRSGLAAATRRFAVFVQDFAALLFGQRGGIFAFRYAGIEAAVSDERAVATMLDLDAAGLEMP